VARKWVEFLDAAGAHEAIAMLDDASHSWGRSVKGVRVMGPVGARVDHHRGFAVHGVQVDRMVAGQTAFRKDVHTVV
jgi:FlaA1/EpsC-like NDP-sugar epimerase